MKIQYVLERWDRDHILVIRGPVYKLGDLDISEREIEDYLFVIYSLVVYWSPGLLLLLELASLEKSQAEGCEN